MASLVSILIPCYNAARWLPETIESALAQTWPQTEIILVDDGSRDESLDIARRFATRGVKVIAQANRGASAARNAALTASQGDWLQFLDADDLLAPGKITHQMNLATQLARADVVLCGRWSRFTCTPADADHLPQVLCTDAAPTDWLVSKFEHNAMMHPAAWLTPRATAERAGPWDESLSLDDDGEYFTRVVLASQGVRFCPDALSYYRSGLPGSLSGAKTERAWTSAYRSLELSVERLRQAEDSSRTRHAGADAFQHFIYEAYPRVAELRRRAAAHVSALGGSHLVPRGGPQFQLTRRLLGWRLAKRLQSLRQATP